MSLAAWVLILVAVLAYVVIGALGGRESSRMTTLEQLRAEPLDITPALERKQGTETAP